MERYREDNPCPKCGSQYVATIYRGIVEYSDNNRGYLERECVRCGYKWREKPLDIEEKTDD